MIVIAHSENMGTNAAHMYRSSGRNRNNMNQVHYSRLFLLRIVSMAGAKNDSLCYVMEAHNTKLYIWEIYVELNDNIKVKIYMIICILTTLPIGNVISGYLPMIDIQFPEEVMRHTQLSS